MTSAASQSLPNFSDNLLDTKVVLLAFRTQAILTTASRPETETLPSSHPSMAKDDDVLFVEKCKGKFIYTVVIRQKILTKAISCHKMIFVKTYLYVNDSEEDQ